MTRSSRLVAIAVTLLGVTQIRLTGGEPTLRLRPARACRERLAALGAATGDLPDDEWALACGGRVPKRGGPPAWTASTGQPGHPRLEIVFAELTRARPVAGCAGRAGSRCRRRPDAREDQSVLMRGRERRRGARSCSLFGTGPRLRAAVYRADAAGPPARLEPVGDGDGGGDPGGAQRGYAISPMPNDAGGAPAETFVVDGGPPGRHDRVGDEAVLRACDRVRLTADGQVRDCLFARTSATCAPCCATRPPTRRSPRGGGRPWRSSCPATGSTIRASFSPTVRCPLSAGRAPEPPIQADRGFRGWHPARSGQCAACWSRSKRRAAHFGLQVNYRMPHSPVIA